MNTEIIYEDNSIIVCRKNAGFPVQTKRLGQMDMENELKNYLKSKGVSHPYVGIVHRLDQPVEGVMVVAKSEKAAAYLSKQVSEASQDKVMKKIYEAKVIGQVEKESAELVNYLVKDSRSNTSKVVNDKNIKDAKKAILKYELKECDGKTSILKIELMTGRHHQIRVQLSAMGHPIIGDTKYGNASSESFNKENNIRKLHLKAVSLSFLHPESHELVTFSID